MKLIIAGSRTITDYNYIKGAIVESGWLDEITEVVSGMARGIDTLGIKFAKECNITVKEFPADWKTYGNSAGHKRNYEMGVYADKAIVIIENESKGSRSMIKIMRELEKPVFIKRR